MFELVLFFGFFQLSFSNSTYPTCGDCWCIPDNNGTDPCPSPVPQTSWPEDEIEIYKSQKPLWIYSLNCNPYRNKNCTTFPRQDMLDVETAVCAFKYSIINEQESCTYYQMITYDSQESAEADGAIITHEGSCGLCSTSQDLAIYLTEDFASSGKICATKGLFNETAGLECYQEIGLTLECSKIWNYDGIYDGKVCLKPCLEDLSEPNNGPPPECQLNDCLQCDEDLAGPNFTSFAGRTRRRSGLISEIIRPCSSIAKITHDPCFNPTCDC